MSISHNAIFTLFKTQITLLENERKAKESHITTMEAALAKSKEESTSFEHQQGNCYIYNQFWYRTNQPLLAQFDSLSTHTHVVKVEFCFYLTELLQDKVKKFESIITSQQVQIQNAEEMLGLNKVRVQE